MTTKTLTPQPVVRDQYYEAALTWAQEFTEGLEELPRGVQGEIGSCPLARATGMFVGISEWAERTTCGPGDWRELPPKVEAFVVLFDDDHYPDLIER